MKHVCVSSRAPRSMAALTSALLLFLAVPGASAQTSSFLQPGTLVWNEEFSVDGPPDPSRWNIEIWPPKVVNEELQAYTNRPENVRIENGALVLEARRDFWQGNEFTSGRVQTARHMDALYGRIEVRAILPEGRGTWPAIWALPTDWVYGNWPTCGEIDIMEHVGYDPGVVHASVHTEAYNHTIRTQKTAQIFVGDFNTAYHVYALEWTPTQIRMFVDGVSYFTFPNEGNGYKAWPFDKPFHVILNVAVGGTWGGLRGVAKNIWPQRMTVDYVKVYTYDFGTDTQAPAAPSNLGGKASSSSITVTWAPATDNYSVKEYAVYRDGVFLGTTIWHEYVVRGLAENTSYNFQVKARDHRGNESAPAFATLSTTIAAPHPVPGKVEAEAYDAQFGIQTESTTDTGGGLNVGWIDTGDWLEYVVSSSTGGSFAVDYRVASLSTGGALRLLDEAGTPLDATTTIPVTGGWQAWTTVTSGVVSLPAGNSRIRIQATQGGWNINWLQFRSVDPNRDIEPPTAPPNLSAATTTTTADLTWGPSTDNIAVAGYRVFRDGVFLGTTSALSYHVDGLASRTGYVFAVRAFDAQNNESAASQIQVRTASR